MAVTGLNAQNPPTLPSPAQGGGTGLASRLEVDTGVSCAEALLGDCPSVLGLSPTRMVLSLVTSFLSNLSAVRRQVEEHPELFLILLHNIYLNAEKLVVSDC